MSEIAGQQARFVVEVIGLSGLPKTGLVTADFSFDFRRHDSASGNLVASVEPVTISEIGTGLYWALVTPAFVSSRYRLIVTEGAFPDSAGTTHTFQFDVESAFAPSTGPFLSTRASVKTALNIEGTQEDGRIDALLASVTALAERYCRRSFFEASRTEYPRVSGYNATAILLASYPLTAISTIHVSTALPRVYGAGELLVNGTNYLFDAETGIVHRVDGCTWPRDFRAIQVAYTGGYAVIPADLQRAAEEIIAAKLFKGRDHQYHFTSFSKDDGTLTGIRFDDVSDNARMVLDLHRSWRF